LVLARRELNLWSKRAEAEAEAEGSLEPRRAARMYVKADSIRYQK
jgi:hypothetical protein